MDLNISLEYNYTYKSSENNLNSVSPLNIILCILNVPLSLVSAVTNGVVLVAIWKTTSVHTPATMLLCNLAVTDLAVGLLVQPLYIFKLLGNLLANFDSVYRPIAMPTFNIAGYCLCGASFFTITAISLDRMIALKFHLRYNILVTSKKTAVVIAVIWVVSAFVSSMKKWNEQLLYPALALIIVVCLLSSFIAYFEVYRIVRRHQAQIHSQMQVMSANADNQMRFKRLRRSAMNTFYVFCFLLICYLPYLAVVITQLISGGGLSKFWGATSTVVFVNSALNPLLYFWRISEIRQAVRRILKLSPP